MKRSTILILSICLAFGMKTKAQSSIMTEISYPFLDKLVQLAKENYPRIRTYEKQINIAEINVKKAKNSWFDVLSFAYMRNKNVGATHANTYLLNGYQYGLNINVGSLLEKPLQLKTAKQELEIAYHEKDEYNLNIEANVKERYFTYIQELTTLKIRMKAVQDAESILKLISSKFEKGEESFDNYNKALAANSNLTEEKIKAESSMLIAKAHLEELVGKKLEDLAYWQSEQVKK
jgi:outer membrane protein TolC